MKHKIILGAVTSVIAFSAHGEYTLKISQGKYPEGVKTENINRNIPDSIWYKKSWTKEGWSTGDYGPSNNVAVSPSHVSKGICENALILPTLKIEEGDWLSWDGCEVYPLFRDTYTVEIRPDDSETWIVMGEFTESKSSWSKHMIDLSAYPCSEAEIRFVCRSEDGYMLALNNISIKKPTGHSFVSTNRTPKLFGKDELEEGKTTAEITVMNTGVSISNAIIGITIDESTISSIEEETEWPTGETRTFRLPLPLTLNERADYTITIEPSDGEKQSLGASFAYCTSFKRHLYVDKGTGMWCNSCPTGTLVVEELEETYGDALIVGETHEGDPLANDTYFSWLKFYAIPYFLLNHIQSTKGGDASRFDSQICVPTEMGIDITGLTIKNDGNLMAHVSVRTSESFSDSDRSYRVGYILTRNVSGNENVGYYQKNICTLAKDKQYRYLPSRMTFQMCSFPNVTIPSQLATTSENPAFTGINGSLPESLAAGETYDCELDIPLPEGFDSFEGIRLVTYIIDAGNRAIINSIATLIDELAGIEEITDMTTRAVKEEIFTIDGRQVKAGKDALHPGLYIIDGKKMLIK